MIASCAEVSCFHTIAKLFGLQAPSQGHHFSIVAPHPHGKFLCSFMYISVFGLGVFFVVVVIGFWFGFGFSLAWKTHACLSRLWRGSALGTDLNLAFQSISFVLHPHCLMCFLSQQFFKVFKQNTYLH